MFHQHQMAMIRSFKMLHTHIEKKNEMNDMMTEVNEISTTENDQKKRNGTETEEGNLNEDPREVVKEGINLALDLGKSLHSTFLLSFFKRFLVFSERKEDKGGFSRGNRSLSPGETGNHNSMSIPSWRPKKREKVSHFDEKPPQGLELPPIGVVTPINGVPNSYFSFSNNPLGLARDPKSHEKVLLKSLKELFFTFSQFTIFSFLVVQVDNSLHTRHARRIYAGGIPPRATEDEVFRFFNDVVVKVLPPGAYGGQPVAKIYLNSEKNYAFVEFPSIELTTACMQLDGIHFEHPSGSNVIRVRRPTDYRPETLPNAAGPTPVLNSEILTSLGASTSGGPGKVFVGGLPYNLGDEQVMELLTAFGPLKSFHQVKEGGSNLSKGYAFCEYYTKDVSDAAIDGLNGMPLGDKVLTVKYAAQGQQPGMGMGGGNSLTQQLLMNTPYEQLLGGGGGHQQHNQYNQQLAIDNQPANYNQQQYQSQQPGMGMGGMPQQQGIPAAVQQQPTYQYGNSLMNSLANTIPTRVSLSFVFFILEILIFFAFLLFS
jgi:U2 snRNP auxiliary factor large subunit